MMQGLIFAAGRIHWRSISVLLGVLWYRYYLALSSKRVSTKRTKTRPEVAHILRRVTQHSQFKDALRLDTQGALHDGSPSTAGQLPLPPTAVTGHLLLSRVCLHFIEETNSTFYSQLAKTPSHQISDYFTANVVVLANFLTAVEALNRLGAADAIICPQTGPLRHFLSPQANRSALLSILQSTISPTALGTFLNHFFPPNSSTSLLFNSPTSSPFLSLPFHFCFISFLPSLSFLFSSFPSLPPLF